MKTDNELIAEFMGWQIDNSFPDKGKVWRSPNGNIELTTTMKYDTSWDWLMLVCDKIFAGGYEEDGFAIVRRIRNSIGFVDIKSAYQSVVDFITWYNSQSSKPE